MKNPSNLDRVRSGADEEEPVVADAEPEFFSFLESLYVAFAGIREAMQGGENASLRFFEAFNFFRGDPEFGQDLLVWNALVMLGPFPRCPERFFLFRCEWFVVHWSVGDGAGDGIKHGFEQADHSGELPRGKAVN
jgi:hypothetical protein